MKTPPSGLNAGGESRARDGDGLGKVLAGRKERDGGREGIRVEGRKRVEFGKPRRGGIDRCTVKRADSERGHGNFWTGRERLLAELEITNTEMFDDDGDDLGCRSHLSADDLVVSREDVSEGRIASAVMGESF
jgi:hypothetical protein